MEFFKEPCIGNLPTSSYGRGFLALWMSGTMPATEAELKAALNIYDISDIYAKSVGHSVLTSSKIAAPSASFSLTQFANKIALKKGDHAFGVSTTYNSLIAADLRRASVPDRLYGCYPIAPFVRKANLGMYGANTLVITPWAYYEGNMPTLPCWIGRSPDSASISATEYEWDNARTFASVMVGATTIRAVGTCYISVDSWDGTAWETVLNRVAKANDSVATTVMAFTKRVTTTRLRIRVETGYTEPTPVGVLPIEVTASAPAPAPVADITWAVLIPLFAGQYPSAAISLLDIYNSTLNPVPFYACSVGGPGDSVGFDLILSQNTGLTTDSKPVVSGSTFMSANLVE